MKTTSYILTNDAGMLCENKKKAGLALTGKHVKATSDLDKLLQFEEVHQHRHSTFAVVRVIELTFRAV